MYSGHVVRGSAVLEGTTDGVQCKRLWLRNIRQWSAMLLQTSSDPTDTHRTSAVPSVKENGTVIVCKCGESCLTGLMNRSKKRIMLCKATGPDD